MQVVVPMDGGDHRVGGVRFVINMVAKKGQTTEVRSCEVICPRHRNRYSFPSRVVVNDVFVDELTEGINHCLSSVAPSTGEVSLPTVTIEIPGLSLAKANLITTKDENGTVAIILRFETFLGQVSNGFRPELDIGGAISDHTHHMSAMVLMGIVMPLLDLCSVAESGRLNSTRQFSSFMDTLIERSAEMRFQAELIKRFVASAGNTEPASEPYCYKSGKTGLASRG